MPGPKKIDFFEKVAKNNGRLAPITVLTVAKKLLDNNGRLAPKAPYLKADFAEGGILPQPFPA